MDRFIPLPPAWRAVRPSGFAVTFSGGELWLKPENVGCCRLPSGDDLEVDCDGHLLIGRIGDAECGALELPAAVAAGSRLIAVELRRALLFLSDAERVAVARAREILFWHSQRKHCGACGALLHNDAADCSRVCPSCGSAFFPVLAPAVIVAVRRGDRLLLAHNRKFRDGMYSLIAGFVEAGENLEQAVAREVQEEIGIDVDHIRYFGSQSWPFPNSLMLGFTADYAGGDIQPDGVEISDAGWFEVGAFPEIPSGGSISRTLIDAFVATVKREKS
jgi:NAD+ diphosphatase